MSQEKSRRGLHGRGAKDILDFGRVEYESLKDYGYAKLSLFPDTEGKIICRRVDNEIRDRLRIKRMERLLQFILKILKCLFMII